MPSAIHGFHEFLTIYPLLIRKSGLLLVDDTPGDEDIMLKVHKSKINEYNFFAHKYGFPPGKGALIKKFLDQNTRAIISA